MRVPTIPRGSRPPSPSTFYRLSFGAAVLAFAGSVIALLDPTFYDELTSSFLTQAIAQDVVNIFVASPLTAVSAVLALRGSSRARALWLGATAFAVYNYLIYSFAIPFGPLFPLWLTVLALSLFALIGGCVSIDVADQLNRFTSPRALATAAWVLMSVAGVFLVLWLTEDVPALIDDTAQPSAVEMGLTTNLVHTLDYAFFLPAAIATAVLFLRRRSPFAHVAIPAFLVFLLLTCAPILVTPSVAHTLGREISWSALGPVGVLAVLLLVTLAWVIRTTDDRRTTVPLSLEHTTSGR